jgi:putative membrane protein
MTDLNEPENNPLDSSTEWAALRTRLAEERTFNAWLRTGLATMAFSLAIARFFSFEREWLSDLMTIGFFLLGVVIILLGLRTYHQGFTEYDLAGMSRTPSWIAGTIIFLIVLSIAAFLFLTLTNY